MVDNFYTASLSSVPVVGCRNGHRLVAVVHPESIKRSGGGVSERERLMLKPNHRVYQAFRWWGVGTVATGQAQCLASLSSVPVVGCRNRTEQRNPKPWESIKRSGGGVSERSRPSMRSAGRVYQAFRWWGVGTGFTTYMMELEESIKRSGGGVSEPAGWTSTRRTRVYQAFRWWGVGTFSNLFRGQGSSLSSVPVVGCRNRSSRVPLRMLESIKRSGGGVSERPVPNSRKQLRVYQAFRWWGVGTPEVITMALYLSLSSVPVVGCRNLSSGRQKPSR